MKTIKVTGESIEVQVPINVRCSVCEGSGIMYVADHYGDDFEARYCSYCPEGRRAEAAGIGEVVGINA